MRAMTRLIVAKIFCLGALLATTMPASTTQAAEAVPLLTDWYYRWGDSPVLDDGSFAWAAGEDAEGWQELPNLDWPDDRGEHEWMWYRKRLPAMRVDDAALYLPTVALSFDVFLDGQRIYEHGVKAPDLSNNYIIAEVHIVPLPAQFAGGDVYLRVYSNVPVIGLEGTVDPPSVGSQPELVRALFHRGADSVVLGVLFIFAGFFALLAFLIRLRENLLVPLLFAVFSTLLGLFYVMSQASTQYLITDRVLKTYAMTLSFLFFPVGMFAYLLVSVFRDAGVWVRRVIWLMLGVHVIAAVGFTVLDLLRVMPIGIGMPMYNTLFTATIPFSLAATLTQALKGSREARIVVWGFVLFAITGLFDLLQGQEVLPFFRWLSPWGALGFVGTLAYVLERDFTESHRRLKQYSVELEEKSEQLEEYSRTLEDKVSERTQDLNDKNVELQGTLQELKDTQQQLIMREKMASLGSLVAGVAHEVNNPIGAVMSASDVSERCVDIVRDYVHEHADNQSPKVKKASDVLADNNRIIAEAAKRVSTIVKSLKNFARLDEAEFQRANVHEGVDSTLTLVKHLLKGRIEVARDYGELPDLLVYPNQLNQVFMNLIVNAVDAIEGEGKITIATQIDGEYAYVRITDTGKGIPPDNLARVFDPGFTTKGVGVGTGLGLSISYNIIEKHNGKLGVESEPGRGTTFTVALPLTQKA